MIDYEWHYMEDNPFDLPIAHKDLLTVYRTRPDLASVPFIVVPGFYDGDGDFRELTGLFNMNSVVITRNVVAWTYFPDVPDRYKKRDIV